MLTFSFLKLCKENYQCSLVKLLAILTFSSLKLCNTCNTVISSFHQLKKKTSFLIANFNINISSIRFHC